MNKILTMAAVGSLVLGGMTMGAANAQGKASGPFADVPTDHWAYGDVETLRNAGIVIGYPDGTYGGRRPMTRYEFATAIARLLKLINPSTDLSNYYTKAQVDAMLAGKVNSPLPDMSGYATKADLAALQAAINARLASDEAAIQALKQLTAGFQDEITKLGVDVAAANKRLDALEDRVSVLEAAVRRVTITGEANFIGRSSLNSDGTRGLPIDKNGYRVGTNTSSSIWEHPQVYHDVLINIDGKVSDNSHLIVRLDAGNYLPWLGNATEQSGALRGGPNGTTGVFPTPGGAGSTGQPDAFDVYEAYLWTPVALGPIGGASAKIGRFGTQYTPYTLKAVNPDWYTSLPETDSGNVIIDGGQLSGTIGSLHATGFAGVANEDPLYNITGLPATLSGRGGFGARSGFRLPGSQNVGGTSWNNDPTDNIAGGRLTWGDSSNLALGATGILARASVPTIDPFTHTPANTIGVFGGDAHYAVPFMQANGLTLDGEWAIDQTGLNDNYGHVNGTHGNEAWEANLGFHVSGIKVKAGYTQVYTNFNAPGSWGQLGSWVNPTNIEGPKVQLGYDFTHNLSAVLEGDFYRGMYNVGTESPLGNGDWVQRVNGGLRAGLASHYGVDLGYEWVGYTLHDRQGLLGTRGRGGSPTEQYVTLGVDHDLSANAAIKVLYQIEDYNGDRTGFANAPGVINSDNLRGGTAVVQTDVKF